MPDSPTEKIAVRCACGVKLAVPTSAIGRNAKCPKCGAVFPITAPAARGGAPPKAPAVQPAAQARARPAEPSAPRAADDEGDSLLDALARQEMAAESTSPPPEGRILVPCPKCKTSIPADSKICVACGYNVATGRSVKAARTQPIAAVKAAKFAGRLSLGVTLSGIGALVGAAIWFVVVLATHVEIGWIAWGVGLLAGVGMRLGYGKESGFAGLIAGSMSIGGILVAKVLIFVGLIAAAAQAAGGIMEIQREMVREAMMEEASEGAAATSNGEQSQASGPTAAEVEERVAQMSDEEIERRVQEYYQTDPAMEAEDAAGPGLLGTFFSVCFHPLDALFILLAVGSAYKLASGGGSS